MTARPPHPRGFVVGAPRSSSGKTTVTLGILRALARRGLAVQGLKCGPDYIDPAFHAAATGRPSFNLDTWAMDDAGLAAIAGTAADGAEIIVAEGLMGLFDGVPGPAGRSGSSADVAARLGWPVLLVLDVTGQAQSAAAIALGTACFDQRIRIGGVVLNRVGSERHLRLVRDAVEAVGQVVIGAVPREASLSLPERHLGLRQARETEALETHLDRLADLIEGSLDLDRLLRLCSGPMRTLDPARPDVATSPAIPPPGQRIALADDAAFSFVYPHVLLGWRQAGAEIVPFSPLADEPPPADCDACWLPGGYPELHAARIAGARHFLEGLRRFAARHPVHGECGGYMVLGETLEDAEGVGHAMAGLLPVATSFRTSRLHLGYREAVLEGRSVLGRPGARVRGHEFHYASIVSESEAPADRLARCRDAYGQDLGATGHARGNVSGTFFHAIAEVGA